MEIIMSLVEEMFDVTTFRGLSEADLQQLAAIAVQMECPAGAILFREGDDSTFIYVLLSGEVSLEVSMRELGTTTIYMAGPGELLGWSPILGHHAMTATARVTTPSRLVSLEVARLNEMIQKDPQFGVAFLKQLALIVSDRLSATRRCLSSVRGQFDSPRFSALHEGSD
jgi:CRP-like cAMP-binding protein